MILISLSWAKGWRGSSLDILHSWKSCFPFGASGLGIELIGLFWEFQQLKSFAKVMGSCQLRSSRRVWGWSAKPGFWCITSVGSKNTLSRQVLDPDAIEALVDALDMDHSGSVPCPARTWFFCSVLWTVHLRPLGWGRLLWIHCWMSWCPHRFDWEGFISCIPCLWHQWRWQDLSQRAFLHSDHGWLSFNCPSWREDNWRVHEGVLL